MENKIHNVILDLGGVLFDVDYHRTLQAFRRLGVLDIDQRYGQLRQNHTFDALETGQITPKEFLDTVRNWIPEVYLTDDMIIEAWNKMLIGLRPEVITFVEDLTKEYRLFLLSNTNAFHLPELRRMVPHFPQFEALFERTYYSHEMGLRKPDKAIFEAVLSENDLLAEESLFVDDSPQHVEGALNAGLHSFYHAESFPISSLDTILREYRSPASGE
jgi:putative hydrolase of the HAD superfamily